MSFPEILDEQAFSLGIAPESDPNTVGTEWTFLDFVSCTVTPVPAEVVMQGSREQRGAVRAILPGKLWHRIQMRFPENGQLAAYAFASDTPDLVGAMKLMNVLGGKSVVPYQASCITASDANTVTVATTVPKLGCLLAGRETNGDVRAMGFVKSIGSGPPYTTQLFEDLGVAPGAGIARIPTVNIYPSTTQPNTWSVRLCGEHATKEYIYLGCGLLSAVRTRDTDDRAYWDVELMSYGGELEPATSGGLQLTTDTLYVEPLIARSGARQVLASNVFATLNDGTYDPDGTCDIRNVELSLKIEHHPQIWAGGRQGVKSIRFRQPEILASFSVPDISDFHVSGRPFGRVAYEQRTPISLTSYEGDTAGRISAFRLAAGMLRGVPTPEFKDGGRYLRHTIATGKWVGDGGTTDAGNKVFTFSQG